MRDLKFRAWDEKFKVMLPEVAVYDKQNIIVVDVLINESYEGDDLDARLETVEDAGPEHYCITGGIQTMQFIDREDCEGVAMYEGDIFRTPNKNMFVVEWDDRRSAFVAKCISDGQLYTFNDSYLSSALIVGHIYETPELLEGSAK